MSCYGMAEYTPEQRRAAVKDDVNHKENRQSHGLPNVYALSETCAEITPLI